MGHDEAKEITDRISADLKARRFELGMSMQELSYRSGVSRTSIKRIEEAERQPNIETILLLSSTLDLPCWKLLKKAESGIDSDREKQEALTLPHETEKAFVKLRKKSLEKPEIGEAIKIFARNIF